jgi:hypothetical protein
MADADRLSDSAPLRSRDPPKQKPVSNGVGVKDAESSAVR